MYIFTQPRAAKQTGHTSYTHTGARGGGLQDYIHTQVPEVPECTFSLNPRRQADWADIEKHIQNSSSLARWDAAEWRVLFIEIY